MQMRMHRLPRGRQVLIEVPMRSAMGPTMSASSAKVHKKAGAPRRMAKLADAACSAGASSSLPDAASSQSVDQSSPSGGQAFSAEILAGLAPTS